MGRKILLVEDDDIVREVTRATLLTIGYQVLTANDGSNGIDMYRTNRRDIGLIVTDEIMPMQGHKMIEHLKKEYGSSLVPFMFLSGYYDDEQGQHIKNLNPYAIMNKPVTRSELAYIVNEALPLPKDDSLDLSSRIESPGELISQTSVFPKDITRPNVSLLYGLGRHNPLNKEYNQRS